MASSNTKMHILLADDDHDVRKSIADFLRVRDHQVVLANNGDQALQKLKQNTFDIVITDIKMPGVTGFEILHHIKQNANGTDVIMMTGFGDIDLAVKAMREGAFDFFSKPVKMQELSASIERTERFHVLRQERDQAQTHLKRISEEAHRRYGIDALIGESPAIFEIKNLIRHVCQTDNTSVLITGETGTGKEVIARAIHYESSRKNGPFVAVDCTAIPEHLFESVFYGHEKGAFTDAHETKQGYFEQAHGGTLFLDEIGDMPSDMQVRLLRTLEERRVRRLGGNSEKDVNVRVISATNQNMSDAIAQNKFREELFHRINTFLIHLPPLRERTDDIPILANHFLRHYAREIKKSIVAFTPEVLTRLQSHPFTGNVRELKNTIERAVILCQSDQITLQNLQFTTPIAAQTPTITDASTNPPYIFNTALQTLSDEHLELNRIEADIIQEALRRCNGNRGDAASILGLSRFALRRRMSVHGIE